MNHQQPGLVAFAFFFFFFSKSWAACRTVWEKFRVLPLYLGKGKEGENWLAVVSKNTRSCAAVFVTTNNTTLAVCLFVCPVGFLVCVCVDNSVGDEFVAKWCPVVFIFFFNNNDNEETWILSSCQYTRVYVGSDDVE